MDGRIRSRPAKNWNGNLHKKMKECIDNEKYGKYNNLACVRMHFFLRAEKVYIIGGETECQHLTS